MRSINREDEGRRKVIGFWKGGTLLGSEVSSFCACTHECATAGSSQSPSSTEGGVEPPLHTDRGASSFPACTEPRTPFLLSPAPPSPYLTLRFSSTPPPLLPAEDRWGSLHALATLTELARQISEFQARLLRHKCRLKSEFGPGNCEEVQSTAGSESRMAAAPSKLCITPLLSKQ